MAELSTSRYCLILGKNLALLNNPMDASRPPKKVQKILSCQDPELLSKVTERKA